MITQKILALAILMIISLATFAQQEDIITDRPDATESAAVVPKKHLQIESGFYYEKSNHSFILLSIDEKYYDYNSTLFRYGLLNFLELRLQVGYSRNLFDQSFFTDYDTSGFSPLVAGAKVALLKEKGIIPQTALLVHVTIPEIGLFAPGTIEPEFRLSFSNTLTERLGLGYNVGIFIPENQVAEFFYTIALGYDLGKGFGVFLENFGQTPRQNWEIFMDGGFTYLIKPNIQLDIFAGMPLSSIPMEYFLGAGISFRIPD